ncbi:hypothetical protein QFZ94_000153 [Paraburkholderia sp. JPY465]
MPYKARLKTGGPRKRPKPNYSVTNAHEYNERFCCSKAHAIDPAIKC